VETPKRSRRKVQKVVETTEEVVEAAPIQSSEVASTSAEDTNQPPPPVEKPSARNRAKKATVSEPESTIAEKIETDVPKKGRRGRKPAADKEVESTSQVKSPIIEKTVKSRRGRKAAEPKEQEAEGNVETTESGELIKEFLIYLLLNNTPF
jgi:hypothetical protein